jgi:outer membrane protein assembly factor BamB
MNILNTSRTIFISLCLAQTLTAQPQLRYEEFGSTEWVARTQPIREGNGVFLSPDEKRLVTSTQPAIVHAFDTESGVKLWRYNPSMSSWTGDSFISCLSGITFASTGSLEYIVYAVVIKDNLSLDPQT